MNKNVLVTGGAGYIGTHTIVELINSGYEVVVLDNFSNSEPKSMNGVSEILGKEIEVLEVDCCDKQKLAEVFEKYKFDSIIHFAGFKAVGESVELPLKYYGNNIQSTVNLLELMIEYSVSNIVFSSSATVYGQPDILPATEQTPQKKATSPYGMTKQMCEDILKDTAASNSAINAIALRYFNPIGAHPSALIGEFPRGVPNNLVPFITQTAAGVRKELSIFGDDYDTPDGTALRDYIDVVDLAKAHVVAISRLLNKKNRSNYEYFNIGTGVALSVLELVQKFEEVNNVKLNYKTSPRRAGDVEKVWADTTLANNELGWKSENSTEETLASAWKWEKNIRNIK